MNAKTRWKEAGSDATPELRTLMKHAATRTPDPAAVAALTEAVLAKLPAALPVVSSAASKVALVWSAGKVAGVALLAGLSAAVIVLQATKPILPVPPPAAPAAERAPAPASPAGREATAQPPAAEESREVVTPHAPAANKPRTKLRRDSALERSAAPADELALLHAARLARRQAPERALSLLEEHERAFPESTFREEREALLIELLRRVDPEQAARRLEAFERSFPHSAYRQSLGPVAPR